MSETNIVKLDKPTAKVRRRTRVASKVTKVAKKINPAKVYVGSVVLSLLALSLTHLSDGLVALTHCPIWEAYAFAIGVDAALVSVEIALISSSTEAKREIGKVAHVFMLLTLGLSAWLNALGFAEGHLDPDHASQIALGCYVPVAVWIMSYIVSKLR